MPNSNLPIRKVKKISQYTSLLNSKVDEKSDYTLDEYVKEQIEIGRINQDSIPRYFFFLHEKRDGELAASMLHDSIIESSGCSSVYLDKAFKVNKASSYIKKAKLKKVTKETGIWPKVPLITKDHVFSSAGWLVSTFISLLSAVISSFDEGNTFRTFISLNGLGKYLPLIKYSFALLSLFLLIQLIVGRERKAYAITDKMIGSLSDEQFLDFLGAFTADDIRLFGIKHGQERINVVCPLSKYTPKQRAILKRYWMSNNTLEYWWIFIEKRIDNCPYVLDKSPEHYKLAFMELCSLQLKQKRDLARQYGRDPSDPGMCKNGVDYIASSLLNIGITPPSESLKQRIDSFVNREEGSFPIRIRTAIDLIAELSTHYQIDFSSGRYWEELFRYTPGLSDFCALDYRVSQEVFLPVGVNAKHLNSLPELVSLILNEFGEELDSIAIQSASQMHLQCFVQLCLIKTLRYRFCKDDECFLAIAGTLYQVMNEAVNAPENFCNKTWIEILSQTLTVLDHSHYGLYAPAFLHLLIKIYDTSKNKNIPNIRFLRDLFKSPIVLQTAKANLLLNHSTDVDIELRGESIDVIFDHYRITQITLLLQGKENTLSRSGNVPEFFGLINLSQLQRKEYYNALCALQEQSIIDYYSLLFDIYCAVLTKRFSVSFIKPVFYKNLLLKYGKDAGTPLFCIKKALKALATLLIKLYPDYSLASDDLKQLIAILDREESNDAGLSLFYLAKWDAFSFVTGSFIAGMICHFQANKEITDYRNIYLNMGNYVIRLIFLAEHENQEESWHNDDFQYLVRILIQYDDPSQYLLTHIALIIRIAMPELSKEQFTNYLRMFSTPLQESLLDIQQKLNNDELQEYISFVVTLPLEKSVECTILTALRNALPVRYPNSPCAQLILELLNYLIDEQFSDTIMNCDYDSLISEIKKATPDTIYQLYDGLCKTDKRFINNCPKLAKEIIKSDFLLAPVALAQYLLSQPEPIRVLPDYISVAKMFYDYINSVSEEKSLIAQSIIVVEPYIKALSILSMNRIKDIEQYHWVDGSIINDLTNKLEENRGFLIEISSKEIFRERKWGRYGLLVFMKYLLTYAPGEITYNQEYIELDELERILWIEKNLAKIPPLLKHGERIYKNGTYIAMLDVFLTNEGNIQERESELEIQSRVAAGAQYAVSILFAKDLARSNRIKNMIFEYCRGIGIA